MTLRKFKRELRKSARRSQPVTISYDESLRGMIFSTFNDTVKDRTCPFCVKIMHAGNFGGVIRFEDEPRFICKNWLCLTELARCETRRRNK